MASTPMDVDAVQPVAANTNGNGNGTPALNITRPAGATTSELTQIAGNFRPVKLFHRDNKDKPQPYVLSLDFDGPGELCMTAESDETIQIYHVKQGRHDKTLLSKKYGAKLARFTHWSASIVYASTKQNDAIRYLATHDNSFIRYFEGHEGPVTSISMHPGDDDFISCSRDGTVRLWDVSSKTWTGALHLNTPYLSAWDPSGQIFAIASPTAGSVFLYDRRNYAAAPFSVFDVVAQCGAADSRNLLQGWTKLEFSNDGKSLLLGTKGTGHFLLDSFDGTLKAHMWKREGLTSRAAPGEGSDTAVESSGDCCFTPDGRFVLSGASQNVLVWDTLAPVGENKDMDPAHVLEDKRETAVIAFNPRYNLFATADRDVLFWVPDPHA